MGISQVPAPSNNRSWVQLASASASGSTGTVSFTSLAAYPFYRIAAKNLGTDASIVTWSIRLNNDTATNYLGTYLQGTTPVVAESLSGNLDNKFSFAVYLGNSPSNATGAAFAEINNTSNLALLTGFAIGSGQAPLAMQNMQGYWFGAAQINRIDFIAYSGNWRTSSNFTIYGSN